MIGHRLAQYDIEEELGRGGMGIVYRARDTRLQRQVALKVLAPELVENPELRRRLLTEARAAAALQHASITVVYEIDEADGVAFIAMELIRGESLQARVRDRSLRGRAALGVAVELAEAHRHGVVHRDLKPSNVMVTASGHAKVIDFGLAKVLEAPRVVDSGSETPPLGDTDPGRLVGTAAHMSPEQVRGEEVDPRSDIFCYGSLLLELLGGESPFKRPSAIETLHAVLKDPAPQLPRGGMPDEVLAQLQRVLDKCLAKDPGHRYQSAADLIVDLRAAERRLDAPVPTGAPPRQGPLRVVIVDDEAPARNLLRELLGPTGVEIVAECGNGFDAVKKIAKTGPDLVFLDIQMPKLNGFEVLELIGPDVVVVFQTAYDEHAVRAFEVNAIDYLLKPVSEERVRGAVDRVRSRLALGPVVTPVAELVDAVRPKQTVERVLVREGADIHVIQSNEIDYVEAQDDYVSLHSGGREHLKQETLQRLESQLDPKRFVRIHRSFLINVERLTRIESDAKDKRFALLRGGARLPVSRSGYARLKEFL